MDSSMANKKYKRAPECAFREIEGETFIVSPKTGGAHLLNSVGAFIWRTLDGEATAGNIADAVTSEFDVDAQTACADVEEFLAALEALEIAVEVVA